MTNPYKQKLLQAGLSMKDKNLTIETWGNISIKDPNTNHIYITPSGMPYDSITEKDICVLDQNGNQIEGNRKPSIEKQLHVLIYQTRKDINVILHTHPIDSTIFGVLHKSIPVITDEMAQAIGTEVQCTDYALPGSNQLAKNAVEALGNSKAVLLSNHGAVCVGKDMQECFKVATVLETSATIYYKALMIGTPIKIKQEDVDWMYDFAQNKYGQ